MRKRLLLSAGTMAAIVGVTLLVLAMLPPSAGVTNANFDRIEDGMSKAEVVSLLGENGITFGRATSWYADDGSSVVVVGFEDDCVIFKECLPSHETILDKIRRWLRL